MGELRYFLYYITFITKQKEVSSSPKDVFISLTINGKNKTLETAEIIFFSFCSCFPFDNVFTSLTKCYRFRLCTVSLHILLISFPQAFHCLLMSGPQAIKFTKQIALKYFPSKGPLFNFCKSALSCFSNLTYIAYKFLHTSFFQ